LKFNGISTLKCIKIYLVLSIFYFTIVCNAGGTNLADATTYYMGQGGYAVSTTVNTRNVYVPFTSTLTNVKPV
jgi:hypothetical protein